MGEPRGIRDRRRGQASARRGRFPLAGALLAPVAAAILVAAVLSAAMAVTPVDTVPIDQRGSLEFERAGTHDANNIRTVFWNYGMVGDYPPDPGNVDLSVFHSVEVPKGSGMNYSDGITPFVLAKIRERNGHDSYIMETGFRERQAISPNGTWQMRFEPRPGFFQADPDSNVGRSPAISNDPRTWPARWPDRLSDPDDPGWKGQWNGYFGKRPAADQESFTVMDDNYYEGWDFYPDSTDLTRKGLGLRIEVRGFQWANPQAGNVIFWHYDITNEGTTDYNDNIIFGLYMDSGVGGSALSCDGIYESDDDNAYFDRNFDQKVINLVYTWDRYGHGRDLQGSCSRTGYLGYAYLETPGNSFDGIDNDEDGLTDEKRDSGPGERIADRDAIRAWVTAHDNLARFEATYGPLEKRPAYRAGVWWTGDEDLDWVAELHDTGADGIFGTGDTGEGDGIPTAGEPNFDQTDLHESDQIGLTGFKMNRIKAGQGNPNSQVDDILFFTNGQDWPHRLFEKFTDPVPANRFDDALASNYNIGFLFASGPFTLKAGKRERFSLALAYGGDLDELRRTVQTVQTIYNANYQFAVPPPMPTLTAETDDGKVRLSWDDLSERGVDPVTFENDFEGYRIYRATDPEFRDPRVITTGTGSGPIGNGRPIAQFDLVDGKRGFSPQTVEGVAYYLGQDTGLTHTWTDSTVTNGQEYFYALCAYDYGSDSLGFYPSENAIAVSRTPRGGIILPKNVVQVRPEPKALGYTPASADAAAHASGDGYGSVAIGVVNSALVPDGHLFRIGFTAAAPESILANAYSLTDSTEHRVLFRSGRDFHAAGTGPVGEGLLPLVNTIRTVQVDSARSGFTEGSPTNARIKVGYLTTLPLNLRRIGFPDDIDIRFAAEVADTSLPSLGLPAKPAKFSVWRRSAGGDARMDFNFRDLDGDGTLSLPGEYIAILTYQAAQPTVKRQTWSAQLDTLGQAARGPIRPPSAGDVYQLRLRKPLGVDDVFLFTTRGHRVDEVKAKEAPFKPYVVPNPYVAAASFEPERFAVSGRGDRRMEFRGLPANCTVRIYTVRGELVRTLEHAGGNDGFVPWDLRTRDNLDVAPGLYIFHVDAGPIGTSIGKFAIIK